MELPHDLKNWHAEEDDAFQLMAPDLAATIFWVGLIACLLIWGR